MIRVAESKQRLHEADAPAIVKAAGTVVNPKITDVVRQDSIYDTCLFQKDKVVLLLQLFHLKT